MSRCAIAIQFGRFHTRCMLDVHDDVTPHLGRGLSQFEYQRIEWFAGDRRAYETKRDDEYAWEDDDSG